MTDRAIIFSAEMVRAVLEGRKSQTRRVFNSVGPGDKVEKLSDGRWHVTGPIMSEIDQPEYLPGDRLWVREAWQAWTEFDDLKPSEIPHGSDILYRADRPDMPWNARKRSARFMCRWMSRATLIVKDVRVERVQDISEQDAAAEGVKITHAGGAWGQEGLLEDFSDLWDSIHAKRPENQWEANPWVVAITFETIRENIDRLETI